MQKRKKTNQKKLTGDAYLEQNYDWFSNDGTESSILYPKKDFKEEKWAEAGLHAYEEFFNDDIETAEDIDYWNKVGKGQNDLAYIIGKKGTYEYDSIEDEYGENFDLVALQKKFDKILNEKREELGLPNPEKKIQIYTLSNHKESDQVRKYLKEKEVDFQEFNFYDYPKMMSFFRSKGLKKNPITTSNYGVVEGFNPQQLQKIVVAEKERKAKGLQTNVINKVNQYKGRKEL